MTTTATLTDEQVRIEADLLDEAERSAVQIRPVTEVHPDATIDDAYRIQAAWLDRKTGRGEEVIGHKIGLTSRAMQSAMNIDTPDSGFLTTAMVFEPGAALESSRFCDPKVEIELAFVLARDLGGPGHSAPDPSVDTRSARDLSIDDVLDATEYVVPAVELIDARSWRRHPETGRTRTVRDTIADNAADAGIVCGGRRVGPRDIDLRWVGAIGYRNGVVEETGLAAGVLDHPATGIVWLARRYAEQGLSLLAGQTILAGSFTRPIDVRAADEFRFDYGELGSFELGFD